jgi:hypothetical protein
MQILASECSGLTNRCDPQALLYRADAAVILTSRSKQFSVSAKSRYQSSRIGSPLCGLTIIERLIAPGLLSVLFLPRLTH